jgi:hypothetical protein
MSNSLAIAAVTATLRNLLFASVNTVVAGTAVTVKPPDLARNTNTGHQLNLFLYQTTIDAAWRNQDMPGRVLPGESGLPPLPLVLHYLLTAYAENDDDVVSHQILGQALSALHDHPLLGVDEIRLALPGNDLYAQIERVRLSEESITVDEMSRLWTAFQTQYRVSATFQGRVVLIESTLPATTPQPALARGQGDTGPIAAADVTSPLPQLTRITYANSQPAALPGEQARVAGTKLEADSVQVRLSHPQLVSPLVVNAGSHTATDVGFAVPSDSTAVDVPAGWWTLALILSAAGQPDRITNEIPFAIAPSIISPMPVSVARDPGGAAAIALTFGPKLQRGQRIALLLGSREVAAPPLPASVTTVDQITFTMTAAEPGRYLARLRVSGVDSRIIDRTKTPSVFDDTQAVTVTP